MNLRNLFILNAIVAALGGLAFLFMPDRIMGLYGVDVVSDITRQLAQLLGAEMIGMAAITWLLKGAGDPEDRRGLVLALLIGWGAGLLVSFLHIDTSSMSWLLTAITYGFFTLAFAYFQFTTPSASPASRPMPSAMSMPAASAKATPAPAKKSGARKGSSKRRR